MSDEQSNRIDQNTLVRQTKIIFVFVSRNRKGRILQEQKHDFCSP